MASSGSFNTSAYSVRYLTFNWWINSQSTSGNYTDIGWELKGNGGSTTKWYTTGNVKVVIDGEQVYFNSTRFNLYNGTTVASGTKRLYHDNNGNKSFSASAEAGIYTVAVNCSGSGSWELTKINRYPSFTANPSITDRSINSITFNWGGVNISSDMYYSLDNKNWTHITSSNTKINNLNPNTSYTIYVQARNQADNSLTTTNTISSSTYDIAKLTEVPDVNIGSAHTIKWTNPSGTTTTLALYKTDGTTLIYNVGVVTGTSKSVTPTASEIYKLVPNSNSIKLRYIITTTANGKSYSSYKECTFNVTNSNPTFSNFTYADTNAKTIALTGNNQIIVKGYSSVKGIISVANKAVAKNSAAMSKYRLVIGESQKEASYSSSAEVGIIIANANNNVFNMYAIDSRGNSTLKTISPSTYKTYSDINIKTAVAEREDNGIGSKVILSFGGSIWNNNFGAINNEIVSCQYKYKKTTDKTWKTGETDITPVISGQSFNKAVEIKGDLGAEGFDIKYTYDLQIIISDKLSSYTYNTLIGTGTPGLAITANGIAILNMYDETLGGALQITGDLYVNGKKIN